MERLLRIEAWLARILEGILVGLFAIFLVLVCTLVVMRYGFAASITGGNEFVTIAFIFTSAIGGAVCIARREHIAITVFIDLLPLGIKKWVHVLGLVLIGVINGCMIVYAMEWIDKAGHNPWQPFGWPQGIVHMVIPVGCGLAILFCGIKILATLHGRERLDVLWLPED